MIAISRTLESARLFAYAMYQRRVPFFSQEKLLAIQRKRIRRIARHAFETVPFYRQAMRDRGLTPGDFRDAADFARLPLIDSPTVAAAPELFFSEAVSPASCLAMHSGGGRETCWDPDGVMDRLAYAERERAVWLSYAGLGFRPRQLYVLPPFSSAFASRRFWDARLRLPGLAAKRFTIDVMAPYERVVEEIAAVRPGIVFSYGSYCEHFFRFLLSRNLRPVLPRVWVYGADGLAPGWHSLIEREFSCVVTSNYAATETGRLGFECERRDGYHLNTDLCVVRIVDAEGRDVQPGEAGEVVISNLVNRATVLLNYRLGDYAEMAAGGCPCGRSLPLLKQLHGRVVETVQTADGRLLSSTMLLGKFVGELQSALKVQVESQGQGRILWKIVPGHATDREAFRDRLLAKCAGVFGGSLAAGVEFVPDIPPTPRLKYHKVVQSGNEEN